MNKQIKPAGPELLFNKLKALGFYSQFKTYQSWKAATNPPRQIDTEAMIVKANLAADEARKAKIKF